MNDQFKLYSSDAAFYQHRRNKSGEEINPDATSKV
jgi:hypothetical protein